MAEETLRKVKANPTTAAKMPQNMEEPALETIVEEDMESEDDILERQVALRIPDGKKNAEK